MVVERHAEIGQVLPDRHGFLDQLDRVDLVPLALNLGLVNLFQRVVERPLSGERDGQIEDRALVRRVDLSQLLHVLQRIVGVVNVYTRRLGEGEVGQRSEVRELAVLPLVLQRPLDRLARRRA